MNFMDVSIRVAASISGLRSQAPWDRLGAGLTGNGDMVQSGARTRNVDTSAGT